MKTERYRKKFAVFPIMAMPSRLYRDWWAHISRRSDPGPIAYKP